MSLEKGITSIIYLILGVVIVLSILSGSAATLLYATGNISASGLPMASLLGGSIILLIVVAAVIIGLVKMAKLGK